MKTIVPKKIFEQTIQVPGSKSISHRMMIIASLCRGTSVVDNLLESDDVLLTIDCLSRMGAAITTDKKSRYTVEGFAGQPVPHANPIYLGNSGTSMRLLAGIAALGTTGYTLTGDERMCQRPMGELLDALNSLGISATSQHHTHAPPVTICGGARHGGAVNIDCSKSSQYLSSLLMIGALMEQGLDITLDSAPVSSPYIRLTIDIMKQFGVTANWITDTRFLVPGGQTYVPGSFHVEPDLSNAGYFWAIGAVTGQMVWVDNITPNSLQGDLKQIQILEQMGCSVKIKDKKIGVCGNRLNGVDVDMADTPDAVPAIAIVASFAKGTTRISNIQHLREKECDRIDALSSQLLKMGIDVRQGHDFLEITGGTHRGASIETFNDHRIAMAFSIPGLMIPGVEIENQSCVKKSFPNYWDLFDSL